LNTRGIRCLKIVEKVRLTESFLNNASWILFGNIATLLSRVAMMVILIKNFPPSTIGIVALGFAISEPLIALFNFNLRVIIATDQEQQFAFPTYFCFRVITSFISFSFIIVIAYIMEQNVEKYFIILSVATFKCVETIGDIYYGLFQRTQQIRIIGISRFFKATLIILSISTAIILTKSIYIAIAVITFARISVIVIFDHLMYRKNCSKSGFDKNLLSGIKWKDFNALLKLGLPLGITLFWVNFNINIPTYILINIKTAKELGIFSALMYIIIVGRVIIYSLGTVAVPRLAIYFQKKRYSEFVRLILILIIFSWVTVGTAYLLSLMVGVELLSIAFTEEYSDYASVLPLVCLAAGFSFSTNFLTNAINATRQFKEQLKVLPLVTFASLICGYFLIIEYEIIGAVITVLVGAAIHMIGNGCVLIFILTSKISK
jgi:O-antigen/teichoic acid export membrane protein